MFRRTIKRCINFFTRNFGKRKITFFGEELRKARLESRMGLHRFSDKLGICPSILSSIERGYEKPPQDKEWLENIFNTLEADEDTKKRLNESQKMPFVMQKMNENIVLSPLTHKSDGTSLTGEEFLKLHEHINGVAIEHNKKADEYNNKP